MKSTCCSLFLTFSLKLQMSVGRQLRPGKKLYIIYKNNNPPCSLKNLTPFRLYIVSYQSGTSSPHVPPQSVCFWAEAAPPRRRSAGEFFPAEVAALIRPRRGGDLCETAGPPACLPLWLLIAFDCVSPAAMCNGSLNFIFFFLKVGLIYRQISSLAVTAPPPLVTRLLSRRSGV